MQVLVVAVLTWLAFSTVLTVEVRNSEVFLNRNGEARQLTHDGKAKLEAWLSPSKRRIAYYEQCPMTEHCTPSVVILDLEGTRLKSFAPTARDGPCSSILSITWIGEKKIAAECHINPSLSEYVETEIITGKITRDLFGYDFVQSPDGRHVAHVGWILHFAPPFAKSNYLQVEGITIYPLPPGGQPVVQEPLTGPRVLVRQLGKTYFGIHDFMSGLAWSADSKHISLIDCTYDWTPDVDDSAGAESNRQCALVVASLDGKVERCPIAETNSRPPLIRESDRSVAIVGTNEKNSSVRCDIRKASHSTKLHPSSQSCLNFSN